MGERLETGDQKANSNTLLDCAVCHSIWRQFADPDGTPDVNLGSFEDALSHGCPKHTPLVKRFKDHCCSSDLSSDRVNFRERDDIGMTGMHKGRSVMLTESLSKLGWCWNLLLVKQDSVPDHVGTARILDPGWADLDIVKQWKNRCLSSHGAKCENPMRIWPTRPAWLIDIENKCVVPGQTGTAFVALSYRWGEDSGFRVHTNTMSKLQKPNALDSPEISEHLPPIIRHAMYLTSVIGERFLWVDALCIVHGGHTATADQLNNTGAIYASAVVTIIAADGDSHDGLLGLRDISAPRKLEQTVIPFGEEKIVVRNTDIFSMGNGTPYYHRGWTYQEYKMSTRRILFNRKELHWECQCRVWHEELALWNEFDKYIDPRLGVILAGFPDMESLGNVISNYNERELLYDEDALPGILGLFSVVSRSFTGGFPYGLPEMLFEDGHHTGIISISGDEPYQIALSIVDYQTSTCRPGRGLDGRA
jgi:hypothetical protein